MVPLHKGDGGGEVEKTMSRYVAAKQYMLSYSKRNCNASLLTNSELNLPLCTSYKRVMVFNSINRFLYSVRVVSAYWVSLIVSSLTY